MMFVFAEIILSEIAIKIKCDKGVIRIAFNRVFGWIINLKSKRIDTVTQDTISYSANSLANIQTKFFFYYFVHRNLPLTSSAVNFEYMYMYLVRTASALNVQ